jgi:hypothetical protein
MAVDKAVVGDVLAVAGATVAAAVAAAVVVYTAVVVARTKARPAVMDRMKSRRMVPRTEGGDHRNRTAPPVGEGDIPDGGDPSGTTAPRGKAKARCRRGGGGGHS